MSKLGLQDYVIEGVVDGKWAVLCNISGNYQRRRVHTLPCPPPEPKPAPTPPVTPVVAAGSVSATHCSVTDASQRWTVSPAPPGSGVGVVVVSSADRKLCLGFDANTSAYGGSGNSVVARPCGRASATLWRYSEAVGGTFLQTAHPHTTCSGKPGEQAACECAHPVACSACHGTGIYTPPTSVELWECAAGADMNWSSLAVQDGGRPSNPGVLLMTGGLCLQAPATQHPVFEAAPTPPPPQRVQLKSAQDLAAEAAPAPAVTKVRVTVTATNGVAEARINEVRLYDAAGLAPFPKLPAGGEKTVSAGEPA